MRSSPKQRLHHLVVPGVNQSTLKSCPENFPEPNVGPGWFRDFAHSRIEIIASARIVRLNPLPHSPLCDSTRARPPIVVALPIPRAFDVMNIRLGGMPLEPEIQTRGLKEHCPIGSLDFFGKDPVYKISV